MALWTLKSFRSSSILLPLCRNLASRTLRITFLIVLQFACIAAYCRNWVFHYQNPAWLLEFFAVGTHEALSKGLAPKLLYAPGALSPQGRCLFSGGWR